MLVSLDDIDINDAKFLLGWRFIGFFRIAKYGSWQNLSLLLARAFNYVLLHRVDLLHGHVQVFFVSSTHGSVHDRSVLRDHVNCYSMLLVQLITHLDRAIQSYWVVFCSTLHVEQFLRYPYWLVSALRQFSAHITMAHPHGRMVIINRHFTPKRRCCRWS